VLGSAGTAVASPGEYVVQFDGTLPASVQRAEVQRAGGTVTRDLHIIGALGARLSAGERGVLVRSPHVEAVTADARVSSSGKSGVSEDAKLRTSYIQSSLVD